MPVVRGPCAGGQVGPWVSPARCGRRSGECGGDRAVAGDQKGLVMTTSNKPPEPEPSSDIIAALWPERVKALVSVTGYLITNLEANKTPLPPAAENAWWYQY